VALSGSASPSLRDEVDVFAWRSISRLGGWIRTLRRAGCSEAIMVGRVQKAKMYDPLVALRYIPDWRGAKMFFWTLRRDKRPYAVLSALINELAGAGIQLIDSTKYVPEHMASAGVMTRSQPTDSQWNDIRFGYPLCCQISRMDIGQSIAVMDRDVLAVEALEGTNAMIERAGQLCRKGQWTLIKVSNTQQDMRVDVPTIGTTTIEKLHAANASCLVLEAGKTIILEKEKVIELADRYKIAVVGMETTPVAPASS
jgi:UDP-2,3-diacylglucosamine hydrolase